MAQRGLGLQSHNVLTKLSSASFTGDPSSAFAVPDWDRYTEGELRDSQSWQSYDVSGQEEGFSIAGLKFFWLLRLDLYRFWTLICSKEHYMAEGAKSISSSSFDLDIVSSLIWMQTSPWFSMMVTMLGPLRLAHWRLLRLSMFLDSQSAQRQAGPSAAEGGALPAKLGCACMWWDGSDLESIAPL